MAEYVLDTRARPVDQDRAEQPSTNLNTVIYFPTPVGITVGNPRPTFIENIGLASLRNQIRAGSLF